jgi:hypothetical protein
MDMTVHIIYDARSEDSAPGYHNYWCMCRESFGADMGAALAHLSEANGIVPAMLRDEILDWPLGSDGYDDMGVQCLAELRRYADKRYAKGYRSMLCRESIGSPGSVRDLYVIVEEHAREVHGRTP